MKKCKLYSILFGLIWIGSFMTDVLNYLEGYYPYHWYDLLISILLLGISIGIIRLFCGKE